MREIALFVEDYAHQQVVGALVRRIAAAFKISVRLDWRNVVGGHGRVTTELDAYLRDLKRQGRPWPDLLIVATDANCKGLNERAREIGGRDGPMPMILALPDPHIEPLAAARRRGLQGRVRHGLQCARSEMRPGPLQTAAG